MALLNNTLSSLPGVVQCAPALAAAVQAFSQRAAFHGSAAAATTDVASVLEGLQARNADGPTVLTTLLDVDAAFVDDLDARVETSYPELLSAAGNEAIPKLKSMSVGQMTNLSMCFAAMDHFNVAFKDAVADEAAERLAEFDSPTFANLLWSFGKLSYYDYDLFNAAANHLLTNADNFDANSIARVLEAFGNVHYHADNLPELLDALSGRLLEDFNAGAAAEAVYAMAKLGYSDGEVLEAIAEFSITHMKDFNGAALGKLVWGLACSGAGDDEDLLDAVCKRATAIMDEIEMHDLARIMWAVGELSHYDAKFLAAAAEVALSRGDEAYTGATTQDLQGLVSAFNKLGYHDANVKAAAAKLADRELNY